MKLPFAAWKQLTAGRVVRGAARRLRSAARRMRAAAASAGFAPGLHGASATGVAEAQRAADGGAWPQDEGLLPWYDRPDWSDSIAQMKRGRRGLGNDDAVLLRKWCEDGYVVIPKLIAAELIDSFVDEIDDVWERSEPIVGLAISDVILDEGYRVHVPHEELVRLESERRQHIKQVSNWRVGQYHLYSRAARQIFDHPEIVRVASMILGRRGEPRYSLMFSKGTEQGLHQDTCVFHIFPRDFMMGVWIACEDISHESGPLEYYPGSHHAPLFPEFTNYPQTNRRTSDPAQSKRYDDYVSNLAKTFQKHELLIRKGDVMFWHPMLIHGGCPRLDRLATRKSFVLHVIAEGADVGGRVKGPFNW